MIQFHKITSSEYKNADDSLKTGDKIYFLEDTNEIYIGLDSFSKYVEFYEDEIPQNFIENKIYINKSTLELNIYDADNSVWIILNPIKMDIDVLNTSSAVSGFAVYDFSNKNFIKYSESQDLDDQSKLQARNNIDAVSNTNFSSLQDQVNLKKDLPNTVYDFEGTILLEDNTEYRLSNVSSLVLQYPDSNFDTWMSIEFSSSESINVEFPSETRYIGSEPVFNNGETWEISIKDKVAICWRVS